MKMVARIVGLKNENEFHVLDEMISGNTIPVREELVIGDHILCEANRLDDEPENFDYYELIYVRKATMEEVKKSYNHEFLLNDEILKSFQ